MTMTGSLSMFTFCVIAVVAMKLASLDGNKRLNRIVNQ